MPLLCSCMLMRCIRSLIRAHSIAVSPSVSAYRLCIKHNSVSLCLFVCVFVFAVYVDGHSCMRFVISFIFVHLHMQYMHTTNNYSIKVQTITLLAPKKYIDLLFVLVLFDCRFFFSLSEKSVFTHSHRRRCVYHLHIYCIVCIESTSVLALPAVHLRDVHSKKIIIKSTNRTVVFHFCFFVSLLSVCFVTGQAFVSFSFFCSSHVSIYLNFSLRCH